MHLLISLIATFIFCKNVWLHGCSELFSSLTQFSLSTSLHSCLFIMSRPLDCSACLKRTRASGNSLVWFASVASPSGFDAYSLERFFIIILLRNIPLLGWTTDWHKGLYILSAQADRQPPRVWGLDSVKVPGLARGLGSRSASAFLSFLSYYPSSTILSSQSLNPLFNLEQQDSGDYSASEKLLYHISKMQGRQALENEASRGDFNIEWCRQANSP